MFKKLVLFAAICILFASCISDRKKISDEKLGKTIYKGLYSYGPEIRTFIDCNSDINYWVVDSSKKLELSYSQFNFEKPYEPVYIEAEGYLTRVDTSVSQSDFDSTLVVTQLKLITKEIPDGPCNSN